MPYGSVYAQSHLQLLPVVYAKAGPAIKGEREELGYRKDIVTCVSTN